MTALDRSPEIIRLANSLGINQNPRPAEAIVEYCLKKVTSWITEFGPNSVESLSTVERIVCAKLRLKFEYIESDEDLTRIENTYTEKREYVIKGLLEQIDDKTFGAVFERANASKKDRDRYVAVIDCRGNKNARRFFTKWHEIAHLLTLKKQLELVLFRDSENKQPEEKMMDLIAARVGFYPSIFSRGFAAEQTALGRVSFDLIQRVRDNVCPDASYESTLNACLREIQKPCLLVRVEPGLSEAEKKAFKHPELFPNPMPFEILRAVSVKRNEAARVAGLTIHRNMRVPDDSCIYQAFHQLEEPITFGKKGITENMRIWRHSNGSTMSPREVQVHLRRHGKSLLVLIVLD